MSGGPQPIGDISPLLLAGQTEWCAVINTCHLAELWQKRIKPSFVQPNDHLTSPSRGRRPYPYPGGLLVPGSWQGKGKEGVCPGQTCNGNFRLWTTIWSMKCLERIASFYLPKYLIATYIVEITSGWRIIETIASFCTIFFRTPCKTKIKKVTQHFSCK